MQFAVALIEYLISGIVASAWLVAVLSNYIPLPLKLISDYMEFILVVYFPIAYILGIYVDAASSFLIRRTKEIDAAVNKHIKPYAWIRCGIVKCFNFIAGKPKADSYERSAEILSYSIPDAVRTMEAYVSRDRIARGMAFNSFIGAVTAYTYAPCELKSAITITCLASLFVSLFAYKRLRRLSSRFKRAVLPNIRKSNTASASEAENTNA
ncbi:hypothetical protein SAMN06296273_2598 [Nitrosomonas ureae]|uniref:Uncharacterized protein n=1 Tax=Nitrosomonas ureae TaxID=44577 RepID=A0A285C0R3_9PROT|nr:hypothetical protein [Nitrosomonas ureae]SNX61144.1 hypothetical protein SAMN06296273_2598 [Nitrosomonas ureae]